VVLLALTVVGNSSFNSCKKRFVLWHWHIYII